MRFERYIAQRFLPNGRGEYSRSLVAIATASIALGVLVMVTAICILRGFQGEIRGKVVGFGSHIVVQSFQMGAPSSGAGAIYESVTPVDVTRPELQSLRQHRNVRHVQRYASKGGMVKTPDQIYGIILKGVDAQFDTAFFAHYLCQGRMPHFTDLQSSSPVSNEIIISQTIADRLRIGLGDKLRTYFWIGDAAAPQSLPYRARAFEICGIYSTDLTDFDDHFIIGDLRVVQRLNNWDSTLVDGYEVLLDDFTHLDRTAQELNQLLPYDLTLTTIIQQNPALFSWLDLLDSNIILIIFIMILVCIVAILSALLIMIFEKTSTIGLLKALGATNRHIRTIFLYKSASIILTGIAIGDALAAVLCGLQWRYHLIALDSESYSMSSVPVDFNPYIFLFVSVGTFVVCLLALLLPTAYIARIHPAKTIRFE